MVNRANMLEIAVRNRSGYSEKVGDLGEATRRSPVKTGELRCDGRPDVDFIAELESNKPELYCPAHISRRSSLAFTCGHSLSRMLK